MEQYTQVASLLMDVEAQLRRLNLWQSSAPPPQALASTQPFAVDTLTYDQWLQFIFIPRLSEVIEQQQVLPANCGISPMAEEYFRGLALDSNDLLVVLSQLDELLSLDA
jgi:uncharacterized protein YqcC (DUF446 family)